ncbi:hypothetical protein ACFY36_05180 [Actinoplanes sp. NPDC000266]
MILAAFAVGQRWSPPAARWAEGLPPEVVTVSDCLADLLPFGDDPLIAPWHLTLADALSTARSSPAAHVLAVSVQPSDADDLARMVEDWIGDYPHPILLNLARRTPPPPGPAFGFEVLGFEAGRPQLALLRPTGADGFRPDQRARFADLGGRCAAGRRCGQSRAWHRRRHTRGRHVVPRADHSPHCLEGMTWTLNDAMDRVEGVEARGPARR